MNGLLHRLQHHPWSLLVSLPRNDVRLAQAALRGGAQGLKVHLNVEHFASGTRFGTFEEERAALERILDAAGDIPVGVVPGGEIFATPAEFAELAGMGIDFFDAYPADAPAWTLTQSDLGRMLAAYHGSTTKTMLALERLGMEMCEASILAHEEYGKALDSLDLARYSLLAGALDAPVIVPSQKKVVPNDMHALRLTGVRGLLIGAIVTGHEPESLESATRAFASG